MVGTMSRYILQLAALAARQALAVNRSSGRFGSPAKLELIINLKTARALGITDCFVASGCR